MNIIKLQDILKQFFNEDIGDGDLSSELLFSPLEQGSFTFYAKESGVFCGTQVIETGFKILDPSLKVTLLKQDGDYIQNGDQIAIIEGTYRSLLTGERVILNLIQRMSGIATNSAKAVSLTEGTIAKIVDTRKTIPGLRMLDKYAVRTGGAFNHRSGLYDCVMLKDNHIAFAGGITNAVKLAKSKIGHTVKVEVEIETKEQLLEAIEACADIVMFDNCTPSEIRDWLPLIPSHITTEASGGITLDNLRDYAKTGVQYISLGALTHSVKALDISALVQVKGVN